MKEGKKKRDWFKERLPFRRERQSNSTHTVTTNDAHEATNTDTAAAQAATAAGDTNRSKKHLPERHPGLSATKIWETAFDELQASKSTEDLVVEYEEFLRPHLSVMASCNNGNPLPYRVSQDDYTNVFFGASQQRRDDYGRSQHERPRSYNGTISEIASRRN